MSAGHGFGTDSLPLAIGIVSFCVAMVAAFASSEAAILASNRSHLRIQQLAEQGDRNALALKLLHENEGKMFATILAIENMFIIFAASFGVTSAEKILGPTHHFSFMFTSVATLALIPFLLEFIIVLFGEITPKTYAAQHSLRLALFVARPLHICINLFYPLIKYIFVIPSKVLINLLDRIFGRREPTPSITEEELRMMIEHSSQEGILPQDERELLQNIFEFADTVVSEIMTTRTNLVAYPVDMIIQEALPKMLEEGYSQYPVYGDSIDDIRGVVYLKDIFRQQLQVPPRSQEPLEAYLRPTFFVPENKKIVHLLQQMQALRTKLAIVADEYGGTEGMVTLADILGEIVGEIADEDTPIETFIRAVGEDLFLVQGVTPLYEVNEELELDLPEGDYQTLAGFVLDQVGHIPTPGTEFAYQGLRFTVTNVIGPKILEVQLQKSQQGEHHEVKQTETG